MADRAWWRSGPVAYLKRSLRIPGFHDGVHHLVTGEVNTTDLHGSRTFIIFSVCAYPSRWRVSYPTRSRKPLTPTRVVTESRGHGRCRFYLRGRQGCRPCRCVVSVRPEAQLGNREIAHKVLPQREKCGCAWRRLCSCFADDRLPPLQAPVGVQDFNRQRIHLCRFRPWHRAGRAAPDEGARDKPDQPWRCVHASPHGASSLPVTLSTCQPASWPLLLSQCQPRSAGQLRSSGP